MSGSISPSPQIVQATPKLRFSGTQCTPILAHVSTCLCTVPAHRSCKQQNRPALSDNSETVGPHPEAGGSAFPEDPRSPARLRVVLGIERSLLLGRGDTTGAQRSQGNDPIRSSHDQSPRKRRQRRLAKDHWRRCVRRDGKGRSVEGPTDWTSADWLFGKVRRGNPADLPVSSNSYLFHRAVAQDVAAALHGAGLEIWRPGDLRGGVHPQPSEDVRAPGVPSSVANSVRFST